MTATQNDIQHAIPTLKVRSSPVQTPAIEIKPAPAPRPKLGLLTTFISMLVDSSKLSIHAERPSALLQTIRIIPFALMHLGCLLIIWAGFSWTALALAIALYAIRMFAITGFYHRYFSHRTFKTSRPMQFVFGLLGCSAVQRGPLWWAAHHREHHRHSDTEEDLHSPSRHGLLWAHMMWFLQPENAATNTKVIPDLAKYPELRFIDRYDLIVPASLAATLFGLGWLIGNFIPSSGTSGFQFLAWGFFVSTVVCYHATYTINSLSHTWGNRRFKTDDTSRNNIFLALLTFGEGWHNNHHYFPGAARQGFYWWEIDLTYYTLWALSKVGLVWDLNPVPARVYAAAKAK
ncbi:MAG: acyl-CoA desaturase [Planctomycetota bacterium]